MELPRAALPEHLRSHPRTLNALKRQYLKNCNSQGNTAYIFGDSTAVFEGCTMNNVSEGTAVTAPRTQKSAAEGFVLLRGSLTANPATPTVRNNHAYHERYTLESAAHCHTSRKPHGQ